ncbi:MAG: hypothetical protein HY905_00170 [Deltaproteobacteria bacterium]|nr:hypothetical protein [Deltaproteobacteria bacterium]
MGADNGPVRSAAGAVARRAPVFVVLLVLAATAGCGLDGENGPNLTVEDGGGEDIAVVEGSGGDADESGATDDGDEGIDLAEEGSGDGDTGGDDGEVPPCMDGVFGPERMVPTAGDEEESPVILPSDGGSPGGFVVLGRASTPEGGRELRFRGVAADATVTSTAPALLEAADIGPVHPMVALPDGRFAVAATLPSGPSAGLYLGFADAVGAPIAPFTPVPDSDGGSRDPALSFDGTDLVLLWTQLVPAGDFGSVLVARFDASTGTMLATPRSLAGGGRPVPRGTVLWGDTRHMAALGAQDGPGVSYEELDRMLARSGTAGSEYVSPAETIPAPPTIAWSGDSFNIVWQSADGVSAHIHFLVFAPASRLSARRVLSTPVGPSAPTTAAVTWADGPDEWGVGFRLVEDGGEHAALARVRSTDRDTTIVGGPIVVNPSASTAFQPSIAFHEGRYGLAWVEREDGEYPMFVAVWGCAP